VQEMIEFTQVLHVPDLHNSLLSVLYLTKHQSVSVFIEGGVVKFTLKGTLLLTATAADDQNIAYLSQPISVHLFILCHSIVICGIVDSAITLWNLSLPCTITTWSLG
jgi:hypothetical protein